MLFASVQDMRTINEEFKWLSPLRILPTRFHAPIDYVVGCFLIVAPWVFGFYDAEPAMLCFVIAGGAALAYSLLTNYELGLFKILSMKIHLTLDLLSGIALAISPWLFGFSDVVFLPHLLFGIFEIIASLITETIPFEGEWILLRRAVRRKR